MKSEIAQRILEQTPAETRLFVGWYADILNRINQVLEERGLQDEQDWRAYPILSQWLAGKRELNLKCLAELQVELGVELIVIPKY